MKTINTILTLAVTAAAFVGCSSTSDRYVDYRSTYRYPDQSYASGYRPLPTQNYPQDYSSQQPAPQPDIYGPTLPPTTDNTTPAPGSAYTPGNAPPPVYSQGGTAVIPGDPRYEDNSRYYPDTATVPPTGYYSGGTYYPYTYTPPPTTVIVPHPVYVDRGWRDYYDNDVQFRFGAGYYSGSRNHYYDHRYDNRYDHRPVYRPPVVREPANVRHPSIMTESPGLPRQPSIVVPPRTTSSPNVTLPVLNQNKTPAPTYAPPPGGTRVNTPAPAPQQRTNAAPAPLYKLQNMTPARPAPAAAPAPVIHAPNTPVQTNNFKPLQSAPSPAITVPSAPVHTPSPIAPPQPVITPAPALMSRPIPSVNTPAPAPAAQMPIIQPRPMITPTTPIAPAPTINTPVPAPKPAVIGTPTPAPTPIAPPPALIKKNDAK